MSIAALVTRGVGPGSSIPYALLDGLNTLSSPVTSLSASPTTLAAGSTGNVVALTGVGTSWTPGGSGFAGLIAALITRGVGPGSSVPLLLTDGIGGSGGGGTGSPIFTLTSTGTGAAITAQQVLSATTATITVNAGTAGTITITDPSTGDTAQIQVAGPAPTTRVLGFHPWPSFLPPFNGAAESVPFEAGYFVSGLPAPLSTSIGGQLLVVFIPDGTVRVHIGVPSYLTQPSLVSATPNAFYNKYIRFAYPQVTTQALAVAQGSSILPLAYTGGILAGDSLIIIPAQASALYATVQSVFSDHVVLTTPLVADVSSGSLVIDVNNQS